MPPIQVSLDLFAVVLDGVLEADGRRRVRALSCRVTQAAQVGSEARCELPRDPAAVSVGDRPVQQARVVGLSPRVEQLARLHPWLHGACKGDRGEPGWWRVHEPRNDDEGDDEQDLKSDPTGHSQRDHPAYALMLRSRAQQLVRLPGLTARARRLGGRGHSHDVVYTARGLGWSMRRIPTRAGSRPRQARIAPRIRRVWPSHATWAARGTRTRQEPDRTGLHRVAVGARASTADYSRWSVSGLDRTVRPEPSLATIHTLRESRRPPRPSPSFLTANSALAPGSSRYGSAAGEST